METQEATRQLEDLNKEFFVEGKNLRISKMRNLNNLFEFQPIICVIVARYRLPEKNLQIF